MLGSIFLWAKGLENIFEFSVFLSNLTFSFPFNQDHDTKLVSWVLVPDLC